MEASISSEEGHAPFELDPYTLDSIGPHRYGGKLKGPMTAHPKIDPETGEMLFSATTPTARFQNI